MSDSEPRGDRLRDRAPVSWAFDEAWWKDITGNAISGLIVVLVGLTTAVLVGWIGSPDNRLVVLLSTLLLAVLIFVAMTRFFLILALTHKYEIRFNVRFPRWYRAVCLFAALGCVVLMLVFLDTLVRIVVAMIGPYLPQ